MVSSALQVPKPGAKEPHPWGLELQASPPMHFNLQGLCGLVPEGALPEAPWSGPVALAAEVPGEHGGPVAGGSRRLAARQLCLGHGPAFSAAE